MPLMSPSAMLATLKEVLRGIPGVQTCAIGLEATITPDQYPLIRIVPTRLAPQEVGQRRRMAVTVYFGAPLLEASDGLEAVYETLLGLEAAIWRAVVADVVQQARGAGCLLKSVYVDTILDEDRLPHYKMMASRFELEG